MAENAIPETAFYVAGGNLLPNAKSYIVRPADTELFDSIVHRHYCYVLTSRQMGKSSLMHRTSVRLREAGVKTILLDLTGIGANLTAEQWYFGLLAEIGKQVSLIGELADYWNGNPQHGPLYRFVHALSDIMLEQTVEPIAIFIDEIDYIRGLKNFSTDEFFAAIRQCFNGRASDPRMRKLTFCLLGVATPADLIRDVHTTPFNIGVQIELADFTEHEAAALSAGLDTDKTKARAKLDRILHWTGGHPYLTQKMCLSVSLKPDSGIDYVDKLCHDMFLAAGVRRTEDNLIFVHNTLRNGIEDSTAALLMYRSILQGKKVPNDQSDPIVALLRLAGVVRVVDGRLVLRNIIYARVFNKFWVEENMPDADLRRERAAYRRGLIRSAAIFGSIAVVVLFFAAEALIQKDLAISASKGYFAAQITAQNNESQARDYDYVADMNLAQDAISNHDTQSALALLDDHAKDDTRKGFDWYWLRSTILGGRETTYDGNTDVFCSAFSPDGSTYVQGNLDGSIAIWNAPFKKPTRFIQVSTDAIQSLAFTKAGEDVVLLTAAGSVKILSAKSFNVTNHWKAAGATFSGIAANSDESLIVVSGNEGLQLFDSKGNPRRNLFPLPDVNCSAVAISHDNATIAVGCVDGTARVFSLKSGSHRSTLYHSVQTIVEAVAFSPDDLTIATASDDRTAVLWNARTGRKLHTLQHAGPVDSLSFSPDGQWLATGGRDLAVRIWNTTTGEKKAPYEGQEGTILTVCFAPSGKLLASSGRGKRTIIWRVLPGNGVVHLIGNPADKTSFPDNPSTYVFSSSGKWIATADFVGDVLIWDAATGRLVHRLKFPTSAIRLVSFWENDAYLLIGSTGGQPLSVYETRSWTLVPKTAASGLPVTMPYIVSPNGQLLVESNGRLINLWDITGRKIIASTKVSGAFLWGLVAFSPDGSMFATQSADFRITFWSTRSMKPIGDSFQVSKTQNSVGVFSPDSRDLILGSQDGPISCWNVAARRLTVTLPGTDPTCALWFQPDGKALKSISLPDKIQTWQANPL